jgi:phospholipid/cholesterol/gamma-HCH transport system substrate-binding protein
MNSIRHVILGLFFFGTLVLLGVITIYLGDFAAIGERRELVAYFDQVDTLGPGDPVYVYGVPSGRIDEVEFTGEDSPPEKRLRVAFTLWRPVTLRQGYEIAVGAPNFLGGRQLDVIAGDGAPLSPAQYRELRGKADASLVRQITSLLGENRVDLRRIVNHLADIVADLDEGRRPLAGILLEAKAHEDLNAAIASGRSILAKADAGEGSIGKALNSPELHDRFVGFLENGQKLLGDAREKPGVIHDLIYDEPMASKLRGGIDGLAEVAGRLGRGEGALGKATLPESEETWNDLKSIAADARAMAADARAGRGALGKLLSDPEVERQLSNIASRFSGVADDVSVIVDGARRGRGVLGLLITDDQARRTVERIIDQVARTIEDAREAAPVSSVASFLFGNL